MKINISDTTTITPNQPPFSHDHVLSLSHLDTDRHLHVNFRYIRTYVSTTTHHHADPFHVINTSLSAALVQYYPFAGTLQRDDKDGRLELNCTIGKGVPVIRATADCSLESVNYLDDPTADFIEDLVPDPDQEDGMANPLVLQVTVFECGGYTLGASVHHAMCDGLGASLFFNAMAGFARGWTQLPVEPVWDRARLLGPREPARVEFPIQDYLDLDLDLDKGFSPYSQLKRPVVRACFPMKEEWLDRFKGFLRERSKLSFTTFEALGAYIWQAKVKAGGIPTDENVKFAYSINIRKLVKFAYSINIRKLVKPELPAGYWGNGCVPMYIKRSVKDLVEQPIWETADLIKKSKYNATDEYVRSFIDFQEQNYGNGITAGKGVSGFTDWRHLGNHTIDFGWGGPVNVLPLSKNLLGSVEPCYFLPYSSASEEEKKDGFRILVYLQENAMCAFREQMERFSRMDF